MNERMKEAIFSFEKDMKKLFGSNFSRLILYGSYARGDYTEYSDVDLMILVKTPVNCIQKYRDTVSDCAFDCFMQYGADLSPVIKNEEHFNYWSNILPYYRTIQDEGVEINADQ